MSKLTVLKFPDPALRRKSAPVESFGRELSALAEAMLATMYAEGGIGLAAPQVGESIRLVVTGLYAGDEERERRDPRVYVNPRIISRSGEIVTEEGCLSVPDFTAEVKRAERITLRYDTLEGESKEEQLEELGAVCLQHEIDHLDGKLFVDHLNPVRRQMVKKRLAKLARSA